MIATTDIASAFHSGSALRSTLRLLSNSSFTVRRPPMQMIPPGQGSSQLVPTVNLAPAAAVSGSGV